MELSTCEEKENIKEYKESNGIMFKNPEEVKLALSHLEKDSSSLKESLLRCYLLNLLLYQQVDNKHPVKDLLIKLSVYISLMDKASTSSSKSKILEEASAPQEDNSEESARRPIDYKMQKNKLYTDKSHRKKEERNPRIKNKRRYDDAKELAKRVRDKYNK
ncbi:hypothetical protein NEFER03_0591 [Nematocida sp. LUAm3]|nr:hypothetical protein NEFER03_0591 [Nematocida sp. LUAm3]KAI5175558.1 hypothetical protein NEFER02_1464 [Nematocida sp. LUAm2]KAI5178412.1 hypothetical protein NEFER01_1559 [Nematocida sp. LUAm1]